MGGAHRRENQGVQLLATALIHCEITNSNIVFFESLAILPVMASRDVQDILGLPVDRSTAPKPRPRKKSRPSGGPRSSTTIPSKHCIHFTDITVKKDSSASYKLCKVNVLHRF
jgi:hypothetical protein